MINIGYVTNYRALSIDKQVKNKKQCSIKKLWQK